MKRFYFAMKDMKKRLRSYYLKAFEEGSDIDIAIKGCPSGKFFGLLG